MCAIIMRQPDTNHRHILQSYRDTAAAITMTSRQWSAAVVRLVALLVLATTAAASAAAPATAPPLMSVATARLPYGRFVPASPSLLDAAAAAKRGVLPRPVSVFGSSPSASTLKVFGIGLQRTGTTSLSNALTKMGLSVIHWDQDCTGQ